MAEFVATAKRDTTEKEIEITVKNINGKIEISGYFSKDLTKNEKMFVMAFLIRNWGLNNEI
jgi:hypothetical protein